eukprot:260282-Rhodomonas_salina.1
MTSTTVTARHAQETPALPPLHNTFCCVRGPCLRGWAGPGRGLDVGARGGRGHAGEALAVLHRREPQLDRKHLPHVPRTSHMSATHKSHQKSHAPHADMFPASGTWTWSNEGGSRKPDRLAAPAGDWQGEMRDTRVRTHAQDMPSTRCVGPYTARTGHGVARA